jgi:hypothetical protein
MKSPLPIDINKCGDGCVYVAEENRCSNACQQFFINDTVTGRCVPSECDQRLPNATLSFDFCGLNCVQTNPTTCGITCPPLTVLDPTTKVCRPEVNCPSVIYDPNAQLRCGEYCVYDITTESCADGCPAFYSSNTATGVCALLECGTRTPNTSSPLICGPYPCFQSVSSCTISCPEMQAPDSKGICTYATLSDIVSVNELLSLDDALNTKLNKNALNPVVNVVGNTNLNNGAEFAGVTINVLGDITRSINVPFSVTLIAMYNSNNSFKATSISGVRFDISARFITSTLISAMGTSQSTFIINSVVFTYNPTLFAPLIICNSFGSIQFTDVSVIKNSVMMLKNADNTGGNICGITNDAPVLMIRGSTGIISSSVFENINTGLVQMLFK